jgi:hypothetical protein
MLTTFVGRQLANVVSVNGWSDSGVLEIDGPERLTH